MSTLPELADRLERFILADDRLAIVHADQLRSIAAELGQHAAAQRCFTCDGLLPCECEEYGSTIAHAESVQKAPAQGCDRHWFKREDCAECQKLSPMPDALTLSHEIQAKRGFSMGAGADPAAQPDAVSGLLDALQAVREANSSSRAWSIADRAIKAYEAQSKAEPKA